MNILITGASGFVGHNLINYLPPEYIIKKQLRSEAFEIKEEKAIIHLAGKAHDLKKALNPQEYYQVNYELTKKLYDAFLQSNAQKFIFISSVKAVADSLNEALTEDFPPDPQTHYGKSKLMAEEYIMNQPLPPGKVYYILRPCMIHGPGNKGNLNLLYSFVAKGFPYPLASFNNERSFLSVKNLCFVIEQLLKRDDIPGGIYNVADDKPLSTNELIRIIGAAIGKKTLLWHVPVKLVRQMAKLGDILKLPLNSERLIKLTENYVVSNIKIKNMINEPLPLQTDAGITDTIKSFLLENHKTS